MDARQRLSSTCQMSVPPDLCALLTSCASVYLWRNMRAYLQVPLKCNIFTTFMRFDHTPLPRWNICKMSRATKLAESWEKVMIIDDLKKMEFCFLCIGAFFLFRSNATSTSYRKPVYLVFNNRACLAST